METFHIGLISEFKDREKKDIIRDTPKYQGLSFLIPGSKRTIRKSYKKIGKEAARELLLKTMRDLGHY